MGYFEIVAWIIITVACLIVMPLFTIAIIFVGAKMPILAFITFVLGVLNMVRKTFLIYLYLKTN